MGVLFGQFLRTVCRHVLPIVAIWFAVYIVAMLVLPMVAVAWPWIATACALLAVFDRYGGRS